MLLNDQMMVPFQLSLGLSKLSRPWHRRCNQVMCNIHDRSIVYKYRHC